MNHFTGVFRYEYRMSTQRWSLWIAFGLLIAFYLSTALLPPETFDNLPTEATVLSFAGTYCFMLNLFMPLVGGILAADRLIRDQKIGVEELLRSTALPRLPYLLGKYFGVLASIVTPVVLSCLLVGIVMAVAGAPLVIIPAMLVAFLGVNLPAYVLVVAFSLACPLVMPVRVYQVLFTGYWFWGNYLSPTVMPTFNGTYLAANGEYVLAALLGGFYGGGGPDSMPVGSQIHAFFNVGTLAVCAALALIAANQFLAWRAARS